MENVSQYRSAKPLSHVLRETSCNYFDDKLYVDAVDFLTSLCNAGTSHHLPILIPFPQQLALLATLVVHPSVTSRTSSSELHQASNDALKLLHTVNQLAGPVNAQFTVAFQFSSSKSGRGAKRRRPGGDPESSDEDEDRSLKCGLANSGSLFSQVEDFWQVLGWAFNCSVAYPQRWDRWKLLLEFFADALEDDWKTRNKQREHHKSKNNHAAAERVLLESIIGEYVIPADNRNARRKIMRSILCDGSKKALSEFGEVFRNELKLPKKDDTAVSWNMDMEAADYGDYEEDEDEENVEENAQFGPEKPSRRSASKRLRSQTESDDDEDDSVNEIKKPEVAANAEELLGGIAAVTLRGRFMNILHHASLQLPDKFTRVDDLFDTWTEFLRPMPLTTFTTILNNIQLPKNALPFFYANLLIPLLNPAPPVYDPELSKPPDQSELEEHFLPYGATSSNVADHAKISLLLEKLVLGLIVEKRITASQTLIKAAKQGIRVREERATGDARKAGKGFVHDEGLRKVLRRSGDRLLALIQIVEKEQA